MTMREASGPSVSRSTTALSDWVDGYLARIGYEGPREPTLRVLRGIHEAHFLHVPFENLDIRRGVRLTVDEAANRAKIISRQRGGFCLEVNAVFASALREIGFRVDVLGACVFNEGALGPEMTHMTLVVHLDEPWLADVGFGARISQPLRLGERAPQVFGTRSYVVANDGDHWFVTVREPGGPPTSYTFTQRPRQFADFAAACDWLQTSPDSRFTQGDLVTLPTETGRITLASDRLIVTEGEQREETVIPSAAELHERLREQFGLTL